MPYKENPKTKGSGIVCCIPQTGRCPMECADCFFQSGRGYLSENDLPNMPDKVEPWQIVRVNDGHDSNVDREEVLRATAHYPRRFYNTATARDLAGFKEPVVLTVNPGDMTDENWRRVENPPANLMFVRIRTNVWNQEKVVRPAVNHYTSIDVPVILTFMAYHDEESIQPAASYYTYRKRTSNPYWVIRNWAWEDIMAQFDTNPLVYSCGREGITTACSRCGNCAREFMNTKERLQCS